MTLRTADGRDFASRVVHPKGAPQRPMSDREISDKFAACAAGIMAPDSIAAAEQSVGRLEAVTFLATITGHFRLGAPTLAETA